MPKEVLHKQFFGWIRDVIVWKDNVEDKDDSGWVENTDNQRWR
jgi:hypothetical protein